MTEFTLIVKLDYAAYCNGCDFLWESADNIECLRTNSKLEYDQRDITRPKNCPLQPVEVGRKCETCACWADWSEDKEVRFCEMLSIHSEVGFYCSNWQEKKE